MHAVSRWSTLILTVVLFVAAATDRNLAYAGFHALAAALGLATVWWRRGRWTAHFLLIFGLIDLYQAAASALGWFPTSLFLYSPTDDAVHLGLGLFLVLLGGLGVARRKTP